MSDRTDRLPKWAQHQLRKLENEVTYWKAKALGVDAGTTGVWVGHDLTGDLRHLPDGSRVTFQLRPDDESTANFGRVECTVVDGGKCGRVLRVQGSEVIVLHPRAGNVVEVQLDPEWAS